LKFNFGGHIVSRFFIFRFVLSLLVVSYAVSSYGQQSNENTPGSLHRAIISGDIEKVKSILSSGVDVNARNTINGTPLHTAVDKQRKEIVQLLLEKNADVNLVNNARQTPLHIAVNTGQKDIVELLVAKGADVNTLDGMGDNALSLAQKGGHTEIAEFLIQHGAKDPKLVVSELGPYGEDRGQERPGIAPDQGGGVQRQPTLMPVQEEREVDVLADPNEIKARIKTFEGLEKSIEEVVSKSRVGMRRWQQTRTDNRTTLVRVIQTQLDSELELIHKVAAEEKAQKTTEAIDAYQAKKKERTSKIVRELASQEKEQRTSRSTGRTRGRSTRGSRGTSSQNSGYTRSTGTYPEQSGTRRGAARRNTSEAAEEPAEPVDPEEQNEINQWLQADVQDYDGKVSMFTAINEQIQKDFVGLRSLSEEEKAKKTTATIDGLLLARKQRYEELNQSIQEEKAKLEKQENQPDQTRSRGQQWENTGQDNQTGTRRRRR
jgi:hypothetical protein